MRQLRYIGLLVGLMPTLSLGRANLKIWHIDESCTNYHDNLAENGKPGGADETSYLQESFDTALQIAEAAQSSLKFALKKRPNKDTDEDGYNKWVRIADTMAAMLGFYPEKDKNEDPSTGYWPRAIGVFEKMDTTLQADKNDPEDGYNPDLPAKPMLACDDNTWQWLDGDDYVPNYTDMVKDYYKQFFAQGAVGAWFKKRRWIFKSTKKGQPVVCRTPTVHATINIRYDILVVCDTALTEKLVKNIASPEKIVEGNLIEEDNSLDIYAGHLSCTLVHELMHWFSGPTKNSDGTNNLGNLVIKDQPAVDTEGKLLYIINGVEQVSESSIPDNILRAKSWKRIIAYRARNVCAMSHEGKLAPYSGPKVTLRNADTLALFALAMYYDQWN